MIGFENGIDGVTGEYLFPDYTDKQLATQAKAAFRSLSLFDSHMSELRERADLRDESKDVATWVDPTDLAKAGWGAIFASDYSNYTLEDLRSPKGLGLLLEHRKKLATQIRPNYFKIFKFDHGWDKAKFLERQKAPISGAVNPEMGVPYYLLIIGDPTTIPYEFQYQLDVQYAVGRIYFDELNDYAHYAQSVVRAETEAIERPRRLQFWGTSNRGDTATQLSAKHLIVPLANWVADKHPDWSAPAIIGSNEESPDLSATKANLDRILNKESAPALLLTASHGVGYPKGHPNQRELQGAFVTQEWASYLGNQFDQDKHLFSANDLSTNANLHGMIAFHFACYGLGTPKFNNFRHQDGESELAETSFIARLPQKMLSHSKGGALAVIGHVDRAKAHSFKNKSIKQWSVFQSTLACLMKGCPVGYAMEYFNQEYAELASDCNTGIRQNNKKDKEIASLWTRSHNARNFIVFGDPAVRVAVGQHTVKRTQESEPVNYFQLSDMPSQHSSSVAEEADITGSGSPVMERLEQLERQVQDLRKDSLSLRQEIENLKQQL